MTWRSDLVPGTSRFFAGFRVDQPVGGWERVSWGDTYGQVKVNYPQATENGRYTLTLESADNVARKWKITFSFDRVGRKLEQVSLSFEGSRETGDFAPLMSYLNRRFGTPVAETQTSATWTRDTSQINLSGSPGGGVVMSELA